MNIGNVRVIETCDVVQDFYETGRCCVYQKCSALIPKYVHTHKHTHQRRHIQPLCVGPVPLPNAAGIAHATETNPPKRHLAETCTHTDFVHSDLFSVVSSFHSFSFFFPSDSSNTSYTVCVYTVLYHWATESSVVLFFLRCSENNLFFVFFCETST